MKFIDIHTHYERQTAEVLSVLNVNLGLNESYRASYEACSVGIHPWHIERTQVVQHFFQLEDICKKENAIAVGEIGLDKTIDMPIELQSRVFEQQIEIADYHQKPIIVHCVRAFSELIALRKRQKTNVPFIVHGFQKNEQILHELLRHDFYISCGASLLIQENQATRTLPLIPTERLFLETDVKNTPIEGVYIAAASILNVELDALCTQISSNFRKITNLA